MMSLMPAPRPQTTIKPAPSEPCLESFRRGAAGSNPLDTPDPIMAAMGAYYAEREAKRAADLKKLIAEFRSRG